MSSAINIRCNTVNFRIYYNRIMKYNFKNFLLDA